MGKKHKSKDYPNDIASTTDTPDNINDNAKEVNEQHVKRKKRKEAKEKLNSNSNDNYLEINKHKKGESNVAKMKNKWCGKSLNGEIVSTEERTKILGVDSNLEEDKEERNKGDLKAEKEPSKRQAKRQRIEMKENEKRMTSKMEATKKSLNYVSKWKHARSDWKFEKLRQIWLMDNLLDKTCVPDDIFPTVLEYFENCKGMAREQLLKKGLDVIRKAEEEENKNEIECVTYQRARKLLQALPIET